MEQNEPLKAAMIGCGRMAGFIDDEVKHYPSVKLPYSHAAAYSEHRDTRIVAACALHQESADRFCDKWEVERSYLKYEEMILEEKPDIVSVTTHAETHGLASIFAAEHGAKGIFCEKPIATSLGEADKVIDACRANGTLLLIGHLRRYHPVFLNAFEYIRSGDLGNLVAINTIQTGEIFHTGTHNLDLLNMAAMMISGAKPRFVQAALDLDESDYSGDRIDHDLEGVGLIRYSDGMTAYIHARGVKPALFDHEFICEGGSLRVFNNGLDWELRRSKLFKRAPLPGAPRWDEAPPVSMTSLEEPPFPMELTSMTLSAVSDLVEAIKMNRDVRSTGVDARAALEIGIGFLLSERAMGARVELPIDRPNLVVYAR